MTPEEALAAAVRAGWLAGGSFVDRRDWRRESGGPLNTELLALVPEEARDTLGLGPDAYPCASCGRPVPEDESDGSQEWAIRSYQKGLAEGHRQGEEKLRRELLHGKVLVTCDHGRQVLPCFDCEDQDGIKYYRAGLAAGRREMAEECEKLVLDDARYGNYMRDGRKLIAEYIRALAAREGGGADAEQIRQRSGLGSRPDVTGAGSDRAANPEDTVEQPPSRTCPTEPVHDVGRDSSTVEPLACTENDAGPKPAPGSDVAAGSVSKGPISAMPDGGAVAPTKATAEPAHDRRGSVMGEFADEAMEREIMDEEEEDVAIGGPSGKWVTIGGAAGVVGKPPVQGKKLAQAAAREAGARAMQGAADEAIQRAFMDERGDDGLTMRLFRKVLAVVRALDPAAVAKEADAG